MSTDVDFEPSTSRVHAREANDWSSLALVARLVRIGNHPSIEIHGFDSRGERILSAREETSIGRGGRCDVVVPGSVDIGYIGGIRSFLVVPTPSGYELRNTGHITAAFVNEAELRSGEARPLEDGDEVRLLTTQDICALWVRFAAW